MFTQEKIIHEIYSWRIIHVSEQVEENIFTKNKKNKNNLETNKIKTFSLGFAHDKKKETFFPGR